MLAMSKIEATFVIALDEQEAFPFQYSKRSKVNVQIMEQMGGGGHFNSAATPIDKDVTIDRVRTQLIDCIPRRGQRIRRKKNESNLFSRCKGKRKKREIKGPNRLCSKLLIKRI